VEDQLHLQGQIYQQKLMNRQQRKELVLQENTRISKINPKSAQLVMEKEYITGETTKDRLMKPIKQTIKPKTLESIPKMTFHPKINENSEAIISQHGRNYYSRYTYIPPADLVQEDQRRRGSAQMGHEGMDRGDEDGEYWNGDDQYPVGEAVCVDDIQSQHSSIPTTLLPQGHPFANNSYYGDEYGNDNGNASSIPGSENPDSTIYNRTLFWREQREKRLYYERLAKEKEEQKVCTFRPKTTNNPSVDLTNRKSIAERHAEWAKRK
jgi:hypothetical protein